MHDKILVTFIILVGCLVCAFFSISSPASLNNPDFRQDFRFIVQRRNIFRIEFYFSIPQYSLAFHRFRRRHRLLHETEYIIQQDLRRHCQFLLLFSSIDLLRSLIDFQIAVRIRTLATLVRRRIRAHLKTEILKNFS